MSTYKGIQGYSVQKLASDPTAVDTIGQLFYNSADNDFKFSQQGTGAWSSGGNLGNEEVEAGATHAGTQTAMLAINGQQPPNAPKANVESYDGSTWTEINNTQVERRSANSAGTVAAAWLAGGVNSAGSGFSTCETYDGTCWATANSLNTYKQSGASLGNGSTTGLTSSYSSESWDGTCWTTVGDLQTARGESCAGGTLTAAIAAGGQTPNGAVVETWDGTSWSTVNSLIQAGQGPGGMGGYTDLVVGGRLVEPSTYYGNTESWDGTCFSEGSNLTLARAVVQGAGGPSTAGLIFGGKDTNTASNEFTSATEEFDSPSYVIKTITSS